MTIFKKPFEFEELQNFVKKNTLAISCFVSAILLITIAYFVYKKNIFHKIKPDYVENNEFIDKRVDAVDLYFFYTNWCPHCKTAKPIWNDLKDTTPMINNVKINYIGVDCEVETELVDKYKVEGYPTIKLIKDNQIIEYDAKPDKETLLIFLKKFL
jgi:thiol-disulfide isomerase/thioredoxin|tara:strand:+ start:2441 stop:2908 length:468 start_codon:yes stop_codon:yes gene_type:complete